MAFDAHTRARLIYQFADIIGRYLGIGFYVPHYAQTLKMFSKEGNKMLGLVN